MIGRTILPDAFPLAHAQDVADFRTLLRPFIGKDSSAIVADFRSKVDAVRQKEAEERSKGFGGLVRQIGPAVTAATASARREMLSSKDIVGEGPDTLPEGMLSTAVNVGSVPLKDEKRGGLWKAFSESENERREQMQRKSEAFQRVMQQREEREKARREEQLARQQARG